MSGAPDNFVGSFETFSPAEAANHPLAFRVCPFPVFSACWTPAGQIVFGGGGGKKGVGVQSGLIVCDVDDELRIVPRGKLDTNDEIVMSMNSHPADNEITCSIGSYNMVVSLSADSSRMLPRKVFHTDKELQTVARFNRRGDRIATGGEEKVVKVWDHPSGNLVHTLKGHNDAIISVDFSQDGSMASSTAAEKKCLIWNTVTGALVKELTADGAIFQIARFIPASATAPERLIVLLNGGKKGPGFLAIWDVNTWQLIKKVVVDAKNPLVQAELSRDGSMIAAVTNDATLYVYTSDLHLRLKRKDCHNLPSTSLAFSPDDSALMSASADKSVVLVPLRPSPSATSGPSFVGNFIRLLANALLVSAVVLANT